MIRTPDQLFALGIAPHKGGGGGGSSKPKLVAKPKPIKVKPQPKPAAVPMLRMPEVKMMFPRIDYPDPPVPPPPPPPATETRDEVGQARLAARREVKRRRGFLASTYAGETGGYRPRGVGTQSTLG